MTPPLYFAPQASSKEGATSSPSIMIRRRQYTFRTNGPAARLQNYPFWFMRWSIIFRTKPPPPSNVRRSAKGSLTKCRINGSAYSAAILKRSLRSMALRCWFRLLAPWQWAFTKVSTLKVVSMFETANFPLGTRRRNLSYLQTATLEIVSSLRSRSRR